MVYDADVKVDGAKCGDFAFTKIFSMKPDERRKVLTGKSSFIVHRSNMKRMKTFLFACVENLRRFKTKNYFKIKLIKFPSIYVRN